MTTLISYHPKTTDLALFETDGDYWIGSYDPHLTHQNNEPLYVWIRGTYETAHEGLAVLKTLTSNEF